MIGKILKRGFWSWWDNLSYSLLTSLVGALNPSFLVLVPTVAFLLTADVGFVSEHRGFWMVVLCTTIGGMWLWPLSVVSHAMHEEMINGPVLGYFKRLWEMTRRYFLSSFVAWLVGTLLGALLGLSFAFYERQMADFPLLWGVLLFISCWLLVLLVMGAMVFVVLVYRSGMKWGEMVLVAFYTVARYALVYFAILMVSWVLFLVFMIPAVNPITMIIPLLTVYGVGPVLHIWTFRYAFDEMPAEEKRRSFWELFTPFAQLYRALVRFFTRK